MISISEQVGGCNDRVCSDERRASNFAVAMTVLASLCQLTAGIRVEIIAGFANCHIQHFGLAFDLTAEIDCVVGFVLTTCVVIAHMPLSYFDVGNGLS